MKSFFKTIIYSLLACLTISCSEDPLASEQYQNEIYMVGAYNRVWVINVKYSKEPIEDYFTVTSSGSRNIGKNVEITGEIDEEIIDLYNKKYLGVMNLDKYFLPLDQSLYSIPSLNHILLEHKKGISVRVPIIINTENIDPDQPIAIPVQLTGCSEYGISPNGDKMLIQLKLINDYSTNYQMEGKRTDDTGLESRIQKVKVATAIGVNTIRLFYAMNNESIKKEDLESKTIEVTVLDKYVEGSTTIKKVTVQAWGNADITDQGSGTYDMVSKIFNISYKAEGLLYNEILTAEKEIK